MMLITQITSCSGLPRVIQVVADAEYKCSTLAITMSSTVCRTEENVSKPTEYCTMKNEGWAKHIPWQVNPRGTGMPHFWGMPRAIRGTTPCDLARGWLTSEHKHLAPLMPLPMLPTLLQHWLDGFTAPFLLAATQGIIWKTSHPAPSDDTTISEATRRLKHRAAASRSFMLAVP